MAQPVITCLAGLLVIVCLLGDPGNAMHLSLTPMAPDTSGNALFIREGSGQAPIAMIHVHGINPLQAEGVQCSLSKENNFAVLKVNPQEHLLLVMNDLDRELVYRYVFTVTCRETNAAEAAAMDVVVVVGDVNDNRPKFDLARYEYSVREEIPVGSIVARVRATDMDAGNNGRVTYSFSPSWNSKFNIDENTGLIRTAAILDREVVDNITVTVVASDAGDQRRLESRVNVVFHLVDINDNSPVSPRGSYHFEAVQSTVAGATIGHVSFRDNDQDEENSRVTLTMGPSALFRVEGFDIKTKQALDSSAVGTHHVTVYATDHGVPPRTSQVEVTITILAN